MSVPRFGRTGWRASRRLRLPREDDGLEADEAHVGEQFAQGVRAGAAGVGELAFQHPSEIARGAGIRRGQMDDGSALNTGSGRELGCLMLEPSSQRVPASIAAWPTVDEDRVHASVSTARASVAMGSDVHQMVVACACLGLAGPGRDRAQGSTSPRRMA
jgi:hypothetical protein